MIILQEIKRKDHGCLQNNHDELEISLGEEWLQFDCCGTQSSLSSEIYSSSNRKTHIHYDE